MTQRPYVARPLVSSVAMITSIIASSNARNRRLRPLMEVPGMQYWYGVMHYSVHCRDGGPCGAVDSIASQGRRADSSLFLVVFAGALPVVYGAH